MCMIHMIGPLTDSSILIFGSEQIFCGKFYFLLFINVQISDVFFYFFLYLVAKKVTLVSSVTAKLGTKTSRA